MFVSVLLPAYNAVQFAGEAIESVLQQTHPNFELILIDDGSQDDTLSMLRTYERRDSRVRVLTHENWGMGASLNHAIEEASYDWLVRMDADDVMEPTRLERQIAFVAENPDVGVASCLVRYIDASGRIIGAYTSDLTTREEFHRQRAANTVMGFHHPGVIMRRDLVQQVGGYRPEYWSADDLDLWNRIAELDTVMLVQSEYLMRYRVHGSSVSHNGARDQHLKVRWVEHSMLARRAGNPELSLEDFIAVERDSPRPRLLNRYRKESGKISYKAATLHYSSGNKPLAVANVAKAFVLYPTYTFSEINKKFLHFRRPGRHNSGSGADGSERSSLKGSGTRGPA